MAKALMVVAVVVTGFVAPSAARATPLTIVETTDFSNTAPGDLLGSLGVGINTVSGTVNGGTDRADYFQVTLPALMELTKFEIDVTNYITEFTYVGPPPAPTATLNKGSFVAPFIGTMAVTGNISLMASTSPSVSGPMALDFAFLSPFFNFTSGGTGTATDLSGYDYVVKLTVNGSASSTVPEPATLTLTALGLAAVVTRYRRRRSAS